MLHANVSIAAIIALLSCNINRQQHAMVDAFTTTTPTAGTPILKPSWRSFQKNEPLFLTQRCLSGGITGGRSERGSECVGGGLKWRRGGCDGDAAGVSSGAAVGVGRFGGLVGPMGMVRNRGLEVRTEGATPTPGEMTLYLKAGPDPSLPGDCPFAHTIRMALSELSLPHTIRPTTPDTKPQWLLNFYGGSLPALRHRKECYVETDVVCSYLDFFFGDGLGEDGVGLRGGYGKRLMREGQDCVDGFFPNVARYLKYAGEVGDVQDDLLKGEVMDSLAKMELHLAAGGKDGGGGGGDKVERAGPYLVADGENFTWVDCNVGPKLYHLITGVKAFKESAIDFENDFPLVFAYYKAVFERPSFQEAIYPEETIVWGWTNARQNS